MEAALAASLAGLYVVCVVYFDDALLPPAAAFVASGVVAALVPRTLAWWAEVELDETAVLLLVAWGVYSIGTGALVLAARETCHRAEAASMVAALCLASVFWDARAYQKLRVKAMLIPAALNLAGFFTSSVCVFTDACGTVSRVSCIRLA
tara:strand:- start:956 stop:1405 length:450 start_codon:yes stop_codon:yes gene_type:complete